MVERLALFIDQQLADKKCPMLENDLLPKRRKHPITARSSLECYESLAVSQQSPQHVTSARRYTRPTLLSRILDTERNKSAETIQKPITAR